MQGIGGGLVLLGALHHFENRIEKIGLRESFQDLSFIGFYSSGSYGRYDFHFNIKPILNV